MSRLSKNAKILLIVGIVLAALCAVGAIVQGVTYSQLVQDPAYEAAPTGTGGFGGALVAWNNSVRAQATDAMNMLIFLLIGLGIGIWCIIGALRPPKPKPAPQPPRSYAEPFDENEPILVSPDRYRPKKKPLYWDEEWDDSDS